ncbi:MAG: hypothetical protein WA813_17060 [Beijerinckiaceae bacterium]|jgi:hypothetical protein
MTDVKDCASRLLEFAAEPDTPQGSTASMPASIIIALKVACELRFEGAVRAQWEEAFNAWNLDKVVALYMHPPAVQPKRV